MRFAWLIPIALLCAACPRTSNTTLPPVKPASVAPELPQQAANSQPASGLDVPPPIAYLALGSAMSPAPLPQDVTATYAAASHSADRSRLEALDAEGRLDWVQAFTTPATDMELERYYQGIFEVRGFERQVSASDVANAASKFDMQWSSGDGRYLVHVYSHSEKRSPALYLIHIRDLGESITTPGIP